MNKEDLTTTLRGGGPNIPTTSVTTHPQRYFHDSAGYHSNHIQHPQSQFANQSLGYPQPMLMFPYGMQMFPNYPPYPAQLFYPSNGSFIPSDPRSRSNNDQGTWNVGQQQGHEYYPLNPNYNQYPMYQTQNPMAQNNGMLPQQNAINHSLQAVDQTENRRRHMNSMLSSTMLNNSVPQQHVPTFETTPVAPKQDQNPFSIATPTITTFGSSACTRTPNSFGVEKDCNSEQNSHAPEHETEFGMTTSSTLMPCSNQLDKGPWNSIVTRSKGKLGSIKSNQISLPVEKDGNDLHFEQPNFEGNQINSGNWQLCDHLTNYKINCNPVPLIPRGLENADNSCFLNATLQALLACPPFTNMLQSILPITTDLASLGTATNKMLEFIGNFTPLPEQDMRKKRGPRPVKVGESLDPSGIRDCLALLSKDDTFKTKGNEEDAEEFLTFLLNALHDEMMNIISNESNVTPISEAFRGQICVTSGQLEDNLEPFFTLPLDIGNEDINSLHDALLAFSRKESVSNGTWRQATLEVLPPVLILQLKQFSFDKDLGTAMKISKKLDFTVNLEIEKSILSANGKRKYTPNKRHYKLLAVVYHEGEYTNEGHYFADCFHPSGGKVGDKQKGGWLRYDDKSVKVIKELDMMMKLNPHQVPYLLFYQKQNTVLFKRKAEVDLEDSRENISKSKKVKKDPITPNCNILMKRLINKGKLVESFQAPVNDQQQSPGYSDMVKQSMDLGTVKNTMDNDSGVFPLVVPEGQEKSKKIVIPSHQEIAKSPWPVVRLERLKDHPMTISDACRTAYNQINKKLKYAVMFIKNGKQKIHVETTGNLEATFEEFVHHVQNGKRGECRYGLLDFGYINVSVDKKKCPKTILVLLLFVPNEADDMQKHLYTSNFDVLKRSFDGVQKYILIRDVSAFDKNVFTEEVKKLEGNPGKDCPFTYYDFFAIWSVCKVKVLCEKPTCNKVHNYLMWKSDKRIMWRCMKCGGMVKCSFDYSLLPADVKTKVDEFVKGKYKPTSVKSPQHLFSEETVIAKPSVKVVQPLEILTDKTQENNFYNMFLELVSSEPQCLPLKMLKSHLISKDFSDSLALKIFGSVSNKLEGKILDTFKAVKSAVKSSLEETFFSTFFNPGKQIDILSNIKKAMENSHPFLIAISGDSSVGKSSMLLKLCFWVMKNNLRVLVCDSHVDASHRDKLQFRVKELEALFSSRVQFYTKVFDNDAISFAKDNQFHVVLTELDDCINFLHTLYNFISENRPDLVLFVVKGVSGDDAKKQLQVYENGFKNFPAFLNNQNRMIFACFDTTKSHVGHGLSIAFSTGKPMVFVGTDQNYTDLWALDTDAVVSYLIN